MRAVDTHAHLDFPQFDDDRSELIERLQAEDVAIINIATDLESIEKVVKLANDFPNIYAAIGLHPTDVDSNTLLQVPDLLDQLKHLISTNSKIVAIGEVGLDYFHDSSKATAEIQKTALRQFLTLAQELDVPVVFHCRDAYGDLLTILKDYEGLRGVIHCFAGSLEQAEKFIEIGMHISFTAIVTYPKNDALLRLIAQIPLEKILLETDCPFLSPQTRRGQRNDPMSIFDVARAIAAGRGVEDDVVLTATTKNAQSLFGLKS